MRQVAEASKAEQIFNGHTMNLAELKQISDVDETLIGMWQTYITERYYENPVTLSEFFSKFTAMFGYFYIIVNKYKLSTDESVAKQTKAIYDTMAGESASKIDGLVRRSERDLRAKSEYYLSQVSWAKGCVNSMQTMLRLYGDESKMTGGNNA